MTVFFEINGTTYVWAGSGITRDLEDQLRMTVGAGGREMSFNVLSPDGRSRSLHVFPGSIGTYAVWESEEHSGHQS